MWVLGITVLVVGCAPAHKPPREQSAAPARSPEAALRSVPATSPPSEAPAPSSPSPEKVEEAPDVAGLVPPAPDPTIAAVPIDPRIPDWKTALAHHRVDCAAFRPKPCELLADFDGDGKEDRAVKIRERSSRRAGIAIRWASGTVSIVGAAVELRYLSTDVYLDEVELAWNVIEDDFSFLERWSILARSGSGFARKPPRSRSPAAASEWRAPGATGAGILLDGGDAAEVLYWDGERWRRLVLGF